MNSPFPVIPNLLNLFTFKLINYYCINVILFPLFLQKPESVPFSYYNRKGCSTFFFLLF